MVACRAIQKSHCSWRKVSWPERVDGQADQPRVPVGWALGLCCAVLQREQSEDGLREQICKYLEVGRSVDFQLKSPSSSLLQEAT